MSKERITNPVIGVTRTVLIIRDSTVRTMNNTMTDTPLTAIIAGPVTDGMHKFTAYQNVAAKT